MTLFVITALLLGIAGIVYAAKKLGTVPDSVSSIAYTMPDVCFTLWIASIGALILPCMLERLPDDWRWIGFFAVIGLLCVAATPFYKTDNGGLHYSGGIMCALCATAITVFLCPNLLWAWSVYLMAMLLCRWRCWCFWGEVTVFVLLCAALTIF